MTWSAVLISGSAEPHSGLIAHMISWTRSVSYGADMEVAAQSLTRC